eukprot:30302-Rhodomonas_salina.1
MESATEMPEAGAESGEIRDMQNAFLAQILFTPASKSCEAGSDAHVTAGTRRQGGEEHERAESCRLVVAEQRLAAEASSEPEMISSSVLPPHEKSAPSRQEDP